MSEAERNWPGLAGRIENGGHILPVRVYFEDTDFTGIVYHGSYVRWCERGRSDFLRLLGINHTALLRGDDGRAEANFVVRRIEMDYLRPAYIDDVLEVHSRTHEIGAATLTLAQTVMRGAEALMRAKVQVVLLSRAGRPLRLDKHIRDAFGVDDPSGKERTRN